MSFGVGGGHAHGRQVLQSPYKFLLLGIESPINKASRRRVVYCTLFWSGQHDEVCLRGTILGKLSNHT